MTTTDSSCAYTSGIPEQQAGRWALRDMPGTGAEGLYRSSNQPVKQQLSS